MTQMSETPKVPEISAPAISQAARDLLVRNSAAYEAGESSVPSGAALAAIQEALESNGINQVLSDKLRDAVETGCYYRDKLQEAIRLMGPLAKEQAEFERGMVKSLHLTSACDLRAIAQFVKENGGK